jgi:sugar fermentation stimulation protein A
MDWPGPLYSGVLLRRYKRFLADIRLDSGETITAHCPNTGAMTGCDAPGSRVWLTRSDNPKRKYPFTWQCLEVEGRMVCIHSALANPLVAEALDTGSIDVLSAYSKFQREVKLDSGSRIDFLLSGPGKSDLLLEVKSVTLLAESGLGKFPDAVSQRARRHVTELQAMCENGQAAGLLFAALHMGIERVAPARDIDPLYAEALCEAVAAGVKVFAFRADIDHQGMRLANALPVDI